MGETVNTAEMAQKIADEVFAVFGWQQRGPLNENWACCKEHKAKGAEGDEATTKKNKVSDGDEAGGGAKKVKTHPSDVVFRYDDPYTDAATYLTTDLKSYGDSSITKVTVGKALRSLCATVDCANVGEFQDRYVSGDTRWHAHGLLFIYNHAGDYAPDEFAKLVRDATPANIRAPKDGRVFVLGPGEIAHLHAVARDLMVYRGKVQKPIAYRWFTPDLIIRKSRSPTFGEAAPIEVLLGPWQIAGVVDENQPLPSRLRLYYRCRGPATVEEFEYLIEFLFRHRLLDYEIDLCFVGSEGPTLDKYQAAVNNVVEGLYGLDEFRKRLNKVKPQVLAEFQTRFSSIDIGMER